MKKWLKVVGSTLAAGALVLGTTAASAANPSADPDAKDVVAAAAVDLAPPPTARQPLSEAKYVAVTPCRIVDTRFGVGIYGIPLGHLVVRDYYVGGTFGFAPQGGKSGGCGIPQGATAVAATLTAVAPSEKGYLRAWPLGLPEPTATVLNYPKNISIGTGSTLSLATGAGKSLRVRNFVGPTDLVIDVQGYYHKPLAGMIASSGEPYAGSSRIVGSVRTALGTYQVQFDRNIHYCTATATVWDANYYASTDTYLGGDYTKVQVRLYNAAGAAVDRYFYIQVDC